MTCPAFGSTSEVSVYYAIDEDPTSAIPSAQHWKQVRITGESLDLNLSSTVSDEITPQRSYSDSILTQGEVSGGFNFEATAENIDDFLIAVLQADKDLLVDLKGTDNPWLKTETIQNGSTKKCLMFLKNIVVGTATHSFTYRGCQIDSLSLNLESGAIINGEVTLMGSGGSVSLVVGTWTFEAATDTPLLSAVNSLTTFVLTDSADSAITSTFQSFNLTFSNQLRQQFAVGTGSLYAAGVASGRFQASASTTQYYSSYDMYTQYVADSVLKLEFSLDDADSNGWTFDMDKLKAQGGVIPLAGGPDADLLISPDMQAFEDASGGTIQITKDVSRHIDKPINSDPAIDDTDVEILVEMAGSAVAWTGTAQTHAASQWQVFADDTGVDYTDLIYDSGEETDLVAHTAGSALTNSTEYWWRCRYRASATGWGPWSDVTHFTTVAA